MKKNNLPPVKKIKAVSDFTHQACRAVGNMHIRILGRNSVATVPAVQGNSPFHGLNLPFVSLRKNTGTKICWLRLTILHLKEKYLPSGTNCSFQMYKHTTGMAQGTSWLPRAILHWQHKNTIQSLVFKQNKKSHRFSQS